MTNTGGQRGVEGVSGSQFDVMVLATTNSSTFLHVVVTVDEQSRQRAELALAEKGIQFF